MCRRTASLLLRVLFVVAGDIESSCKRSLRMNLYQADRIAEEVSILRERATMLRYTYIVGLVKYYFDEFQGSRESLVMLILKFCLIRVSRVLIYQ